MYKIISNFGSNIISSNNNIMTLDDPLTYCIGNNLSQRFNHGSNADVYGQNSKSCQAYLAQRCAKNWDSICEYAASECANNEYATRANTINSCCGGGCIMSPGDILLKNTALEKYRIAMLNCEETVEPFDPLTANSPLIHYYSGSNCVPIYEVNPINIDNDPVMNKILNNPKIAINMLINIKNTMRRKGTLGLLRGTRLGNFYGLM